MKRLPPIGIVSLLSILAIGCPTTYDRASKKDTPEAYRAFIRDNPDDAESDAARDRLEDLEFEAAQRAHTVLAYKRFLEEFPKSEHAPTAMALLETLRWNTTVADASLEAYRRFLHEHPDGAHHVEAERRVHRLEEEAREQETEPARLKQAISSASDAERPKLDARLDDLTFAAAVKQGTGALLQYLNDFPAGMHRDETQRILLTRKLDGLLFSGLIEQAEKERSRSPLGSQVPDWSAHLAKAQSERAALKTASPWVPPALPDFYLRSIPDLTHAITSPDPLDRWEAVQELGEHISVEVLDPLLEALLSSKNPRVRQTAFESLLKVVAALPPSVAENELSVRLANRRANVSSPELHAQVGALLELLGQKEEAATEYQRGFDPHQPDPIVLWRFMTLSESQHKAFSEAVAARQIGLWARDVLEELGPEAQNGHLSLAGVRQLCAVAHLVRIAHTGLEHARQGEKEFPEDVDGFLRESTELRRLSDARLRDAELVLQTHQPGTRSCDDHSVSERLSDGVKERAQALRQLPSKLPRVAPLLLGYARDKDPSPYIRELAANALAH